MKFTGSLDSIHCYSLTDFNLRLFNSECWVTFCLNKFNSSDGRVVRASASGTIDSSLNSSRVKPMTLKLVFTASLLDVQH